MDSMNLHFESLSNLDMQPLSCQVNRLSPAKSTSSIDQFTHHHGKGDSAYSSFSGGSNALDYTSPFLPEDVNPHSLQYTDLKYVKAVYSSGVLDDGSSPSVDRFLQSVGTIPQESHHHDSGDSAVHYLQDPPPPPPARLDSFVIIKNLENTRVNLSPHGPWKEKPQNRSQITNTDTVHPSRDSDSDRRVSQPNVGDLLDLHDSDQTQQQPRVPDHSSHTSPSFMQPGSLKEQGTGNDVWPESQRKRSRSVHVVNLSEQLLGRNGQQTVQNVTNGNIQHKGHYYFVTGVCRSSSPPSLRDSFAGVADGESSRSALEEPYRVEMRPKSHSFVWHSHENSRNKECFPTNQDVYKHKLGKEAQGESPPYISDQGFHSFDGLEERLPFKDTGLASPRHHSSSNRIFYCGPEEGNPEPSYTDSKDTNPTLVSVDEGNLTEKAGGKRLPLNDLASDKINKETTPLLYRLTGENRDVLLQRSKNEGIASEGWRESKLSKAAPKHMSVEDENQPSGMSNVHLSYSHSEESQDQFSTFSTGTLDDSFKKYYKEKLKDAQSKVLRETSFKRKDLQLSWPHRVKQRAEPRPSVLQPFKDCGVTSDSPAPPLLAVEMREKENKGGRQEEKEEEELGKENGRPVNVPQPQVPRIGNRRRLTPEQKKLCYSEPEKLNEVGARPAHAVCSSLGSEAEGLLSGDELGRQGLVASRRKMFDTRSRAFSTSSATRSTLKHIQHKALVAYMERKVGQKVAEPQQPTPAAPAQRHSVAGKPPDWVLRPLSGNVWLRKKLRPLSAGRVLDSSSSSARYAQSSSHRAADHARQAGWKDCPGTATGKSASVETLLDQPEPAAVPRARSVSTPHAFEEVENDVRSSVSAVHNFGLQRRAEGETRVSKVRAASVPDEDRVRVVAPRGKSMEELGAALDSAGPALSKSSEQLDQVGGGQAWPGRGQRSSSFWEGLKRNQLQSHRKPFVKQESAPELAGENGSPSSSQQSCLPDIVGNSVFYISNSRPLLSHDQGSQEREPSRTSSTSPSSPTGSSSSAIKTTPPVRSPIMETSLSDQLEAPQHDAYQATCLGQEDVTDPSSWLVAQDDAGEGGPEDGCSVSVASAESPALVVSEPQAPGDTHPAGPDAERHENEEADPPQGGEATEAEVSGGKPEVAAEGDAEGEPQWRVLVEEVVAEDKSLVRVLFPVTNRKTAVMLMEQLLSEDTLLMEEHYRTKRAQQASGTQRVLCSSDTMEGQNVQPPCSDNRNPDGQKQEGCVHKTEGDIAEKKRLLMEHIREQLQAVESERTAVRDEAKANMGRGGAVDALVQQSCQASEYERYTLFVGDLERVVSLLLCLSARLARVQNALSAVGTSADAEEKQSLDNRHRLLCKQQADAKELKDNLDRRERVMSGILARYLTSEQLQEYRRFVQTTAALLIRQKDLDERQRLGEEQLESLLNSM